MSILIDNSANWKSVTSEGAPVIRQAPRCVFGKAITSRMFSSPSINITRRSSPGAIPACGGVPYCNASIKYPNLDFTSSGDILATGEHMMLHVNSQIGKASEFGSKLFEKLSLIWKGHKKLSLPEYAGKEILV